MKQTLLLLLVAWLPIAANAYDVKVGSLYYNLNSSDGTASVTYKQRTGSESWLNDCSGAVEISDIVAHNNLTYRVTSIGEHAFDGCSSITSISIPNSINTIDKSAFSGCTNLPKLVIPNSVKVIGKFAFSNCSGLKSIVIPNSDISIGENAFAFCTDLTSITIPDNVADIAGNAFGGCSNIESVKVEKGNSKYDSRDDCNAIIEKLSNTLIMGCKNTIIPNSVQAIGEEAFVGCTGLTSIAIPNNVTSINYGAFKGCTGLTSIVIPNNVTSISDCVFEFCSGLTSIEIPNNVKSIGSLAFDGCSNLSSVNIPDGITTIDTNTFLNCKSLTSINIPNGVTSIGYGAFSYCTGLTSIVIPNSVTSIEERAFYECSSLATITIPDGLASLGFKAFEGTPWYNTWYGSQPEGVVYLGKIVCAYKGTMSANTEIEIKDGTWTIGGRAFNYCKGLSSIKIPNSVTSIGDGAFYGCADLISIEIPKSVKSIGDEAFWECRGLTSIDIHNVTSVGERAFGSCSKLSSIKLPNDLISIGDYTFSRCSNLTSISIPNSVTSIGYCAFSSCSSLTSIKIPNHVMSIDYLAFYDCNKLTSVIIDQQEPLSLTGSSDFSNSANAILYVPEGSAIAYAKADYWKDFKEIKEFPSEQKVGCSVENDNTATVTAASDPTEKEAVIPEIAVIDDEAYPVTAIGNEAFKDNTALSIVCIPKTIEKIGESAFSGCSGLNAIYSYTEDPIALDSKAAVRTRADGDDTSASAVFAEVDKASCILYVPKSCGDKYRTANGWKEFQNIVEMESTKPGDANNDTNVDGKDINATVDYILEGKTKDFIFKNADVKVDNKINAADIVKIVNLITDPK